MKSNHNTSPRPKFQGSEGVRSSMPYLAVLFEDGSALLGCDRASAKITQSRIAETAPDMDSTVFMTLAPNETLVKRNKNNVDK